MPRKKLNGTDEFAQGVAVGHCVAWLEAFAERSNVPFPILAGRVGASLLGETSRENVGIEDSLPPVRGEAAKAGSTLEPLALASGTHIKPQVGRKEGGALGQQRKVACPVCHAKAGRYCKTISTKGGAIGTEMKTGCHSLRISAAGLKPRGKKNF